MCKSHTSLPIPLSTYPVKKPSRKTILNLGGGVLILIKNGLTYTSLSTQSLSSLGPSSDYLAITVKIKEASPIHLFNVYVPPICSSSSDSRPKSFSPFPLTIILYHQVLVLPSLAILTAIIHLGTLTHRKTNQAKICSTGSFLLIFYLLTTPNITPYYTVPLETTPPPISLSGSCPHSLQMHMADPSGPRLRSSSDFYLYYISI